MHFLSMWLSGSITITNRNGDSASPWNIPLGICISVNLFSLAVSSTLQFSMGFSINFMPWPDILYVLRQLCRTIWYAFLWSIYVTAKFFCLVWLSLRMCRSIYSSSPELLVHLLRPFCFCPRLISESYISLICVVSIFHIIARQRYRSIVVGDGSF